MDRKYYKYRTKPLTIIEYFFLIIVFLHSIIVFGETLAILSVSSDIKQVEKKVFGRNTSESYIEFNSKEEAEQKTALETLEKLKKDQTSLKSKYIYMIVFLISVSFFLFATFLFENICYCYACRNQYVGELQELVLNSNGTSYKYYEHRKKTFNLIIYFLSIITIIITACTIFINLEIKKLSADITEANTTTNALIEEYSESQFEVESKEEIEQQITVEKLTEIKRNKITRRNFLFGLLTCLLLLYVLVFSFDTYLKSKNFFGVIKKHMFKVLEIQESTI